MSSILKVNTIQDTDGNNIINENANTITIGASGDTITIPSGATITNNGTANGFAGIQWQSSIKTANFTAVSGEGYFCDTNSVGAFTLTLPSSPNAGDIVAFKDYANTFNTANLTIGRNSSNIGGNASDATINTQGIAIALVYADSTKGWLVTESGLQSEAPQNYSIDFLVVAGGAGGGGYHYGGGGGAGGYRESTQSTGSGITVTVTVGDGGGGTGSGSNRGDPGSNSSISGSGFTTITSAGGGGGGSYSSTDDGLDGGSGGGASGYAPSASDIGLANTPSTSPSQGNNGGYQTVGSKYGGGGGGGAGAVGANTSDDNGAAGGAGTASSITGSSVTRAGGGGGAGSNNGGAGGTGGSGGSGGGGNGGTEGTGANATAGTANTGGGDGGMGGTSESSSGAGGKGVVILSMPDADYSGTTTGSPTVATGVSGKTVLTFNGTGSYTT